jgi:hypothetical protein
VRTTPPSPVAHSLLLLLAAAAVTAACLKLALRKPGSPLGKQAEKTAKRRGEALKQELKAAGGYTGMRALTAVCFFCGSGGPWGSEELFQFGPLFGVAQILLLAAVFALPQIQLTAELSGAFPVNGGYTVWVTEAFGPFYGFVQAYLKWVSGTVDGAVYPIMIFGNLAEFFPDQLGRL